MQNGIVMTDKRESCPKCSGTLIWNGSGMSCITCTYIAPDKSPKTKSESKITAPKKTK